MSQYSNYNNTGSNPFEYRTPPEIFRGKPYVSYALIAVNVLVYFVMTVVGKIVGWSQSEQLFYFGAKVNEMIAYLNQYWRLFTCMFLHIGISHLVCNCYAIFVYGPIVERLYGRKKMLIIYAVAGLAGSVMSYLFSPNASAGASGAIFGLIGCMLYFRKRQPELFRRIFGKQLAIVLGINLILGFIQPGIDYFGHIGGLIGGLASAYLVGLYKENVDTKKRLATALLILFVLTACCAVKGMCLFKLL